MSTIGLTLGEKGMMKRVFLRFALYEQIESEMDEEQHWQ